MLSAQELIEPKSASTSQTACRSAAMVRLRSMSATASPYAAGTDSFLETAGLDGPQRYRLQGTLPMMLRRIHDDL